MDKPTYEEINRATTKEYVEPGNEEDFITDVLNFVNNLL